MFKRILMGLCFTSLCFAQLRADINNDGRVDFGDYAILAEEWLMANKYAQFDGVDYLSAEDNDALEFGTITEKAWQFFMKFDSSVQLNTVYTILDKRDEVNKNGWEFTVEIIPNDGKYAVFFNSYVYNSDATLRLFSHRFAYFESLEELHAWHFYYFDMGDNSSIWTGTYVDGNWPTQWIRLGQYLTLADKSSNKPLIFGAKEESGVYSQKPPFSLDAFVFFNSNRPGITDHLAYYIKMQKTLPTPTQIQNGYYVDFDNTDGDSFNIYPVTNGVAGNAIVGSRSGVGVSFIEGGVPFITTELRFSTESPFGDFNNSGSIFYQ